MKSSLRFQTKPQNESRRLATFSTLSLSKLPSLPTGLSFIRWPTEIGSSLRRMKFLDVSARTRFWVLLALYALELTASLWLAYELRFDFVVDPASKQERLLVLAWLVPLQLLLLGLFHQLKSMLGY